ncbi:MAG: efflux RND transporter periplasmic adaptor subunit [Sumerlaeia bacterium]
MNCFSVPIITLIAAVALSACSGTENGSGGDSAGQSSAEQRQAPGQQGEGGGAEQQSGPRAQYVIAEEPTVSDIQVTIESVGTAKAVESADITAEVSGIVAEIAFTEGEYAEDDELLLRLDASTLRARLEKLEEQTANRRKDAARAEELFEGGVISAAEYEDRQTEYETTRAELAELEERLDDYTIRAPFSGQLGLRRVSPGSLVEPGTVITTLRTLDPMEVLFAVPEEYLTILEPGRTVYASPQALKDERVEGEVVTVDNRVDPQTRQIPAEAHFDNGDGLFKPGMFVQVELVVERRADAIQVPESALILRGDSKYVFVIADGQASRREVTTGHRREGMVEIREGLAPDDAVIVQGTQNLTEGMPVTTEKPSGGAGQGGGGKRPS